MNNLEQAQRTHDNLQPEMADAFIDSERGQQWLTEAITNLKEGGNESFRYKGNLYCVTFENVWEEVGGMIGFVAFADLPKEFDRIAGEKLEEISVARGKYEREENQKDSY